MMGVCRNPNSANSRFAELLAEGFTVQQAAERLGKTAKQGNAILQTIRARLGSQAV